MRASWARPYCARHLHRVTMLNTVIAASAASLLLVTAVQASNTAPMLFRVTLTDRAPAAESGRLLVFAQPWDRAVAGNHGQPPMALDADSDAPPAGLAIAAQETSRIAPGETQWVDADRLAFPDPFSTLKPGVYAVQAVLDTRHNYTYVGRASDDAVSPVVRTTIGGGRAPPALVLTPGHSDNHDLLDTPRNAPPNQRAAYAAARPDIDTLDVLSPSLSAFWGRPIHMRGWVVRPPGYEPTSDVRYPAVYWTVGFGGHLSTFVDRAVRFHQEMAEGKTPPMIYVLLDESSPTGTHEFADSVNNGPWGEALTRELIPNLENRYRMDGRPSGRLLSGHSSGGWATLWLQTHYPGLFGGTWSTAPDPSDFHDFVGIDLYAPNANVYRRPNGSFYPAVRDKGQVLATFEQLARQERVLGPYGGQIASFEWVFSPRGEDGRPVPMFDRETGAVNPAVVIYWRDHFDIAWRLAQDWPVLKPDLDGKIHLIVGSADTYYLDGAAHRLKAVLDGLGVRAEVTFVDGRTHNDLNRIGADPYGLEKQIAWAMWAVARPDSALKPKS